MSFPRLEFEDFEQHSDIIGQCQMAQFINSSDCLASTDSLNDTFFSACFNKDKTIPCQDAFGFRHQRNYTGAFWSLKLGKRTMEFLDMI